MTSHATGPQAFVDAVQHVAFGPVSVFQNLSVVPLLSRDEREADYLTLDEAIAGGWAEITEVSDAGQVSELKVVVKGDRPVLLVDGEELVGAKQNRVLNLTILVPAPSTTPIPVSCVESGRWRHRSRAFESSPRAHFAEGRAARVQQVTDLAPATAATGAQTRARCGAVLTRSPRGSAPRPITAAMSAAFDKVGASLDELRGGVPAGRAPGGRRVRHQRPAGRPRVVRRGKHVAEAVAEAGEELCDGRAGPRTRGSGPMASPDLPNQFAGAVASSPTAAFPAAGEGEDVRLTGSAIAGAALVARGRAVHVTAFPQRG